MNAPVLLQPELAADWRSQRGVAITLAVGVLALGLLFHQEVMAAVHTWMDSTAYNHCFLVVPIAAYLAWDRRDTLRGCVARPMPIAALAAIPIALAWLLAERLGIMEGRQLMVMSFVELLAFAVLGWRLWWMLSGPLLYLYFLVPFGDFLTPRLQDFTTAFVAHGLSLLNIPAYITGYTIEIPQGVFYIAEACAGLRFLIASIAFGALYALLMYRSSWRRAAFIVASLIVPIIANGLRAVGIVSLGYLLGSAKAAATDHILYGWIFFSLVILLLIALGLPFREDIARPDALPLARVPRPDPLDDDNTQWRTAALATGLLVVLAAVNPVLAMQLDRVGLPAAARIQAIDFGPGCADLPADKLEPLDVPGRLISRRIACDGLVYDVRQDVFATHSTAAPVMAAFHRFVTLPNPTHDEEFTTAIDWLPLPRGAPRLWRLAHTTGPGPLAAVAIWVDGKLATGGVAMRARLAWSSLAGASVPPVVVAVVPEKDQGPNGPNVAERLAVVLAHADISAQISRIVGGVAASPPVR